MNPDGMVALLNYREDGTTRMSRSDLYVVTFAKMPSVPAYFTFWKHGLKEVKL